MVKKNKLLIVLVLLTVFIGNAQDNLNAMRTKYDERLAEIQEGFEAKKQAVLLKYVNSLEVLEEKAKAKGVLDDILEIRKEMTRFNAEQTVGITNLVSSVADLKKVQISFMGAYDDILVNRAKDFIKLCNLYDSALKTTEIQLTSKSDIKSALRVREEREKIRNSKELTDAKKIIEKKSKQQTKVVDEKQDIKMTFKPVEVEGFFKFLSASLDSSYDTYRGGKQRSFSAYSGAGQYIEWKTGKVPSGNQARDVLFVWAGANCKSWGNRDTYIKDFNLSVNGTFLLKFNSGEDGKKHWQGKDASLRFEARNESKYGVSGVYYLTVPVALLKQGEEQVLRIESKEQQKGHAWVMVHDFQDVIKDIEK